MLLSNEYFRACFVSLQLLRVDFLSRNFRLSELYLQDNRLYSVAGAIAHLRSLQILYLHNNQLQNLEEVVHEFRHLTSLKILSEYCFTLGFEVACTIVLFDKPCLLAFSFSVCYRGCYLSTRVISKN
jgi:hypothetical protein